LGCKWDDTKKSCAKDTTTPPTETKYVNYCDSFNETDCPTKTGCLWFGAKCTHFTGCTAFNKTSDNECAAISKRCKTDGTHCVEINNCSTYLKATSCTKNKDGKYCFWDTTVTPNVCVDASKCEHYPSDLNTDELCRT
jgi:Notch-like protein